MQIYTLGEIEQSILVTIRDSTLDEINSKQLLQSSKMVAVGQLAGGMAHQIRNPLSIIRMHTYLLRENQILDEQGNRSLQYIDENVQKAGGIIDNVMNFWHVSGNEMETMNLFCCIENIISLHEISLKNKNIEVETSCKEDLNFVCNQESLKHILENLVSNAIDAMEEGGILLISGEEKELEVIIQCVDNGIGIAEAHMETLFNPFFTTKELGKGTGLGLFIVYSEVEKLSGKIEIDSKEGEGTSFTIILPKREVL